ncbi:MAG: alpha/beta fold hydrolase [Candidatus Sungbacteria bacterium]|nr:alpha/beta fold hydrolase [Candidatus Sungbacteria bacterium]
MNERVSFVTEDGATIVGDYYEGGGDRAALLLHMMPSTRGSWTAFANTLVADGFSAFAIDLRGHGESTKGPNESMLDYKNFSDEEHGASIQDIISAVKWLREAKGMHEVSLAGASIGANLAFLYAAGDHMVRSVILLSPGLNYRGTDTLSAVDAFGDRQRFFFLASGEDEYSAASTKELFEKLNREKKVEIFHDAGHGTTILERKPEYLKVLADWLSQ